MKTYKELEKILLSLDGKSYSAYKSVKGEYKFEKYMRKMEKMSKRLI